MERPFIILGGGGHALVVASLLRLCGASILGFTDPSPEAVAASCLEYLGDDDVLDSYAAEDVYCAMGVGSTSDTQLRRRLFEQQRNAGFSFPPITHPSAVIAPEATIKAGTQVMAGAVIQPGAVLAENVIVNTNAAIDHDCWLDPHVHVAPGATLSGGVHLESGVHVGTGASIIQNVRVGSGSVIGAGAVVLSDVPPQVTVMGVPAKSAG